MLTKPYDIPGRQRGAVLFFAIIVLVVTTLAGLALTRSVDTGNLISGNLAFHQAAVNGGDAGIERAIGWLAANNRTPAATLPMGCAPGAEILWCNPDAPNGYSAVLSDPGTGQSWGGFWNATLDAAATCLQMDPSDPDYDPSKPCYEDNGDNTPQYTIQRLCTQALDPDAPFAATGQICSRPPVDKAAGKSHGGTAAPKPKAIIQIYYRVTVRIDGPRNTLSYVQALIAI